MGKPPGCRNRAKNEVGQATCTRGLQVAVDEQIRTPLPETESLEESLEAADAGTTEDTEGTHTVRPGSPRSTIIGNISSIEASSSETISCNGFGDCVTKLAPSRNSQRGYGGVTKDISGVH